MTSAQHPEDRQLNPGQVYALRAGMAYTLTHTHIMLKQWRQGNQTLGLAKKRMLEI